MTVPPVTASSISKTKISPNPYMQLPEWSKIVGRCSEYLIRNVNCSSPHSQHRDLLKRSVALLNCGITTYIATFMWHYYIVALLHIWQHCYIVALVYFLREFQLEPGTWHLKQESNSHLKASNKFSFQYIFLSGAPFVCVNAENSLSFEFSTHILRNEKLP